MVRMNLYFAFIVIIGLRHTLMVRMDISHALNGKNEFKLCVKDRNELKSLLMIF